MKTTQLHIITVGVSLLSNFEREKGFTREQCLRRGTELFSYLKADPARASAELSALTGLVGSSGNIRDLECALVHTQTEEGQLATRILQKWLVAEGVAVTRIQLSNLDLPAVKSGDREACQRAAETGLRELRDKLVRHIQKAREKNPLVEVFINATGGFKAQIAVAYSVGRLMDARTYYLHESFRSPVFLP